MSQRRHRRQSTARPTIAALVLLVLTACAGGNDTPPVAPTNSTEPSAQTARIAPVPRTPAVPAAPINDDPAQLLGQASAGIDSLLGAPVRVRRDGTAEIRQYRLTESCQLDAFMYAENGSRRAVHVEVRDGSDRLADDKARLCMRQLIQSARTS